MFTIDITIRIYWIAFRCWLEGDDWEDAVDYAHKVIRDGWR